MDKNTNAYIRTTGQSEQLTQVWHALPLGDLFFMSDYLRNQAADLTVLGLCAKAMQRTKPIPNIQTLDV